MAITVEPNRVLMDLIHQQFGGPRTNRAKLPVTAHQRLFNIVFERRRLDPIKGSSNPVIEATLCRMRSSGFEDPLQISDNIKAHLGQLFARYNPQTEMDRAILILQSIIPPSQSFIVSGQRYNGLFVNQGGLEIYPNDNLHFPPRLKYGSLLPSVLLKLTQNERGALCLEYSFLLIALMRAAGLEADIQPIVSRDHHANVVAKIGGQSYVIDPVDGSIVQREVQVGPERAAIALHYNNKAEALFQQKRIEEAIAAVDMALELNPRDFTAWNNKGRYLLELGMVESIECFEKALEINSKYVPALVNAGNVLIMADQYAEGAIFLQIAASLEPRESSIWANLSYALLELGRAEEAMHCSGMALALDPTNENAVLNRSRAYQMLVANDG